MKQIPPVLFEVKCGEQILHYGGFPWHYVTSPPKKKGVFEVRHIETNEIAQNGKFDFPNDTTEEDSLVFHSDDSGRLIYQSANSIRFYKIIKNFENNSKKTSIQHLYDLRINDIQPEKINDDNHNFNHFKRDSTKNVNYRDEIQVNNY